MVIFGGWNGTVYLNHPTRLTFPFLAPSQPPSIFGFTPLGGQVGALVEINGTNLGAVTQVQFNGTDASILAANDVRILTQVPPGATTGPIRVSGPYGEAVSAESFEVGALPVFTFAAPDSGKPGTLVEIHGQHFTGATRVSFGGAFAAPFAVISDTLVRALVDSLAATGPIVVTTPVGEGQSDFEFLVIPLRHRATLVAVRDVPGDQGGKVAVKWDASDYDDPRYHVITGYRVWRRAPPGTAGARALPAAERPPGALDTDYWESVAEIPAVQLDGYAFTAATPQDSIAGSNPFTAFFVQALTADRFTFYNSNVDSGYSVDNLSPPAPVPFAAVYEGTANALHWTPSRAADFREFRLHRGSSVSFVPGAANLVIATRDTGHVDRPGPYVYKLTAVDLHGNRSPYAVVTPQAPVAALATLASIEAAPSRIRVAWFAGVTDLPAATVYRRTMETAWAAVASRRPDGAGYLRYDDGDVAHGVRYGYRLGLVVDGEERFAGEAWATADAMLADAVGVRPNPSRGGPLTCEFTLAAAGPATLELFDVLGRRRSFLDVAAFGAGRHTLTLPSGGPLPPGLYLLRLTARGAVHTARTVVIE